MRVITIFLVLFIAGCGKIYDYEIKRVADHCGGYGNIKSMWLDASTVRAYCMSGQKVSVKD